MSECESDSLTNSVTHNTLSVCVRLDRTFAVIGDSDSLRHSLSESDALHRIIKIKNAFHKLTVAVEKCKSITAGAEPEREKIIDRFKMFEKRFEEGLKSVQAKKGMLPNVKISTS